MHICLLLPLNPNPTPLNPKPYIPDPYKHKERFSLAGAQASAFPHSPFGSTFDHLRIQSFRVLVQAVSTGPIYVCIYVCMQVVIMHENLNPKP